ncbi:MAG: extracellular solute-binding protein family 1 [Paenibacillus sp.]|jgi:multiple sugar transport system substrate-binding protein|nr:extracellular solute-binding protein family 1 [Paenibacillus sp.]
MKRSFKSVLPITGLVLIACMTAGCGGKSTAADPAGEPSKQAAVVEQPKPVTIRVGAMTYTLPKEDFQKYMAEPLKAKYPHITLEYVDMMTNKAKMLDEMITAGTVPDLLYDGITNYYSMGATGLPMDMTQLAQKYKYNFNVFDSSLVNNVKMISSKGEMLFFPFFDILFVTHYNKGIFDKFGVNYPKDNMTWEETLQLANRFNRTEDNLQYQGLNMNGLNRIPMQLTLPLVDRATDKGVIQSNPGWKTMFEMLKPAYVTPDGKALTIFGGKNQFIQKRNLAIFPDLTLLGASNVDLEKSVNEGLEWDMVTYPVFKNNPVTVGGFMDGFVITKTSKNPDDAFKVLMNVASESVQLRMTREGKMTVLNDTKIREQIMADNPLAKGKNIKAIFALPRPGSPYPFTRFDSMAMGTYNTKAFTPYVQGKNDLNTLLREADETLNQQIEEEKRNGR